MSELAEKVFDSQLAKVHTLSVAFGALVQGRFAAVAVQEAKKSGFWAR
ncbi:hypothetical protein [Streptomyces sp. NPDC059015]